MSIFSFIALPREIDMGLKRLDWLRDGQVSSKVTFRSCFKNKFIYMLPDNPMNYYELDPKEASEKCLIKRARRNIYEPLNGFLINGEFCEIYSQFITGTYRKKDILGPPKKHDTILLDDFLLTQKMITDDFLKVTIKKAVRTPGAGLG